MKLSSLLKRWGGPKFREVSDAHFTNQMPPSPHCMWHMPCLCLIMCASNYRQYAIIQYFSCIFLAFNIYLHQRAARDDTFECTKLLVVPVLINSKKIPLITNEKPNYLPQYISSCLKDGFESKKKNTRNTKVKPWTMSETEVRHYSCQTISLTNNENDPEWALKHLQMQWLTPL